ncbi:MAG: hypothetical protein JO071_17285 [Deltaproteobacteria bacterium]|nr:hypothetical protein [Deltaproteobacteria bacterium]
MRSSLKIVVALAATTALCGYAFAKGLPRPYGGSSKDSSAKTHARLKEAKIRPEISFEIITNAQYAAAGTGLRNRDTGTINISGFVPPLQKAILYWGVLCPTSSACGSSIFLQREFPSQNSFQEFTGILIGTGSDMCWASDHAEYYKAELPASFAPPSGDGGEYVVGIPSSEQGITDFSDPWKSADASLPQWEGASLVLVGTGTSTINIMDVGLAGAPFVSLPVPPFTYSVTLFGTPSGGPVTWSSINADGQVGSSTTPIANEFDEQVTINGTQVSGPSTGPATWDTDSDFNGNDTSPLPQLWDTRTHDISRVSLGSPPALSVSVTSLSMAPAFDCIETVANITAF